MKKTLSKNHLHESLAKAFITYLLIFIFIIAILATGVVRYILMEDICAQEARAIVGKDWAKPIKLTEQEEKTIPYVNQFIQDDNTILWGVKEMLLCEKNYKYFFIF